MAVRPGKKHDFLDLQGKSKEALEDPYLIRIALEQETPSSAEKRVIMENLPGLYSTQTLARIKRDYPIKFLKIQGVWLVFLSLPKEIRQDILRQIKNNLSRLHSHKVATQERLQ